MQKITGAEYPNVVFKPSTEEMEAARSRLDSKEDKGSDEDYGRNLITDSMIRDYLNLDDWRVNENSNMSYSLQGLNNHIISGVTSKFWLEKVYPPAAKAAHLSGDFHIHDLGLLAPYCCGWSLEDLLLRGFGGVPGKTESAPARHFRTALGQIVNFFYTLQGEAAGAQAFANFDTLLAPYIRSNQLDYDQVKQAMQEFIFNLNVPTRVGFQTPFVNVTMDLVCPTILKDQPAVIGGQHIDLTYGEFQEEMDMLNRAFCDVMMAGDAKGRIFSFPIPTYNVSETFDWDSEVVDRVAEMTAKYGIPYFANFVNSDMSSEDARSMCCRLKLDNRQLRKRGGGLFGANPLTGSIGVITLNMARIGYLSDSEQSFTDRVEGLMDLAKEALRIKRKTLEQMTQLGLYPYSRHYLGDIHERFGEYWKNHFNTIGLVGMNEAIRNFMGTDIADSEGTDFACRILDFMRDKLVKYQEEEDVLFNLEATPAESVTYRLSRLDKERFGQNIIQAGDDDTYYTNSTQLPVDYTDDLFEAMHRQERLQVRYTGGTVFHGFLGERIEDIATCKKLIKSMIYNSRIPYITLTPTFSICPDHNYITGEHYECPHCGKQTEVWSRVVGFHRPVQNWNKGKQTEFQQRVTYAQGG